MVFKNGLIQKTSLIICFILIITSIFSTLIYAQDIDKEGVITGSVVNLRSGPGTDYEALGQYIEGDIVYVVNINNNWAKVKFYDSFGFVFADYIDFNQETIARLNAQRQSKKEDVSKGSEIVNYAKQFIGTPYVYGGSSPSGFDCSGFVKYIYSHFGYTVDRTASGIAQNGSYVSKSNLVPGDIVCFYTTSSSTVTHVGIYVGDGMFIHSPSKGKTVCITDINSSYYGPRFAVGRRLA